LAAANQNVTQRYYVLSVKRSSFPILIQFFHELLVYHACFRYAMCPGRRALRRRSRLRSHAPS
jgi:hypothetical protein